LRKKFVVEKLPASFTVDINFGLLSRKPYDDIMLAIGEMSMFRQPNKTLGQLWASENGDKVRAKWSYSPSGKGGSSGTNDIPATWFGAIPQDTDQFLELMRECLPSVFEVVAEIERDSVIMLVDLEDVRWRGLLGLLHVYGFPFSPEILTRAEPNIDQKSQGPFYCPPIIKGKTLTIGVYAVGPVALADELCCIRGIPIPFIKQVREIKTPKGMFTVVYFLKTHLGVRHMSPDARICEIPNLPLSEWNLVGTDPI